MADEPNPKPARSIPPSSKPPLTPKVGDVLDSKYEIIRPIGAGAWGDVFEGVNVRIKLKVAIKVLKAEYATRTEMLARFEREALAATHIDSPYVCQVYDAGTLHDGRPYIVMEYLTGTDLGKRLRDSGGSLGLIDAVNFCIHAARGLGAAHQAEIFHRDMKPDNLFIAKTKQGDEIAKIVDFGISKLMSPEAKSQSMTQTGHILGSPIYMSPEQARGAKTTDHRSDLYSLGVVLFESVTGRTPFTADTFNELMFKIALEEPPLANTLRPEVDDGLTEILVKALKREPAERFQSAHEFETALVGWLEGHGSAVRDWKNTSGPRDVSSAPSIKAATGLANTQPGPFLAQSGTDASVKKVNKALFGLAALPIAAIALYFLFAHKAPAPTGITGVDTASVTTIVSVTPSATVTTTVTSAPSSSAPTIVTSTEPPPSSSASSAPVVGTGAQVHAHKPDAAASAQPSASAPITNVTPSATTTASVGGRTIHTTL
jgi:serine/threonine protein kinase